MLSVTLNHAISGLFQVVRGYLQGETADDNGRGGGGSDGDEMMEETVVVEIHMSIKRKKGK